MIRTAAMAILLATSFVTTLPKEGKGRSRQGESHRRDRLYRLPWRRRQQRRCANPHLAGQVEEYSTSNCRISKSVDGKPAARNNAIMGGMAAPLSDEDMKTSPPGLPAKN